jgi:hypothetical protein
MPSTDTARSLVWKKDVWGTLEPAWNFEPETEVITKIARRELNLAEDAVCEIKFLAQGAFNKVYAIRCGDDIKHIIRVSLPVQPHLKTLSEAATIGYVRHHTNIPAPKVWASNADSDNDLGFEWMIQDFVPGRKLEDAWKEMSWLKKEELVRKVIGDLVQLFQKRFSHLGNLYATKDLPKLPTAPASDTELLDAKRSTDDNHFRLSQIVSMRFVRDVISQLVQPFEK